MIQTQFFQELRLMIDSHCHLNFKDLKNNLADVIKRAKLNNITSILSINTDPNEFQDHYNLINDYKSIFMSFGLHPQNVTENNLISVNELVSTCEKYKKIIGIGETGLDFFHSTEFKKEQFISFENHIECSNKTNLPLIIHQRNSENEIIDVLTNYQKKNPIKVVFHCFTGTKKLRDFCLDNEYYISLSGIVTFKNAENLRKIISTVPLESILLETDSPFLAPSPYRGKINEPSYIKYIAECLSETFSKPFEEIIKITDNNFYNLFSKAIRYNELS